MTVKRLNQQQLQEFAVTVWFIWNGRNSELHGDGRQPAKVTVNFVRSYMTEYNQAQLIVHVAQTAM